jgi:RNA polymerase sigma factor (sigma-70 family)
MTDDVELLRRYAEEKSEGAFTELVRRRVDFVYACALRRVGGDAHLAEDVTQHVFTALARQAPALARREILSGWFFAAARNAAVDLVRRERRRTVREQEAHIMNELTSTSAHDAEWERLRPVIDGAMDRLNHDDREAVLLRFFERKSFAEVGAKLRLSENSARMRVERALDKLHALLMQRGVTSTAAALGLALGGQASIAAPSGLAAAVSGTALANATSGAGLLGGLGAFFSMSKIKIGIVGLIVVAGVTTAIVELQANRNLQTELREVRTGQAEIGKLKQDNRRLNVTLAKLSDKNPEIGELALLRNRAAQLKARPAGVVDSEMKPASAWQNAGWGTPEAALETVMWAGATGNSEELVNNAPWLGAAKAEAEAAFAKLPDPIRAKFGTADRFLGAVAFGSRGKANDAAVRKAYGGGGLVEAFQVIDTFADEKRRGVRVRWWERTSTGEEREQAWTFTRAGDRFTLGEARWSEKQWQFLVEQVDAATGELLPKKITPLPAKSEK